MNGTNNAATNKDTPNTMLMALCRLELNYQHAVISKNGYYVDRYLCIHLYELMDSLPLYYLSLIHI